MYVCWCPYGVQIHSSLQESFELDCNQYNCYMVQWEKLILISYVDAARIDSLILIEFTTCDLVYADTDTVFQVICLSF